MKSDILSSLKGGYPHLTEKILNLLDARSLANAELVCRQWRSFIADGRCWKKYLLSKKVTSIPNIFSWALCSGDKESSCKQEWIKIYNFYQKLENNWQSASYSQQEIVTNEVKCFSMNTTEIFTAEIVEKQCLIKTWNRKTLQCERIFTDEDKLRIVSMDCDDDFLVTMSIAGHGRPDLRAEPSVSSIFVRELKSGEVLQRIVSSFSPLGRFETAFKVCFGHGMLISHQIVTQRQQNDNVVLQDVLKSRLEIRRMTNEGEIEAEGTVSLVPISKSDLIHPVLIGHDENYLVVHRCDPPRFEIMSTSSLQLTRTIDAFDNCRSVQYKNGLIVSGSARMGTHTRTTCMIRVWDVETGLCLREIQEPEPTRYHNMNHQVGSAKPPSSYIFPTITRVSSIGSFTCVFMRVIYRFTTNYLVTVPDLPFDKKRVMTIRDLGLIAMDLQSHRTQSASALLATRELDWDYSSHDRFIVDDFQLVYFHHQLTPYSSTAAVYSFVPQV